MFPSAYRLRCAFSCVLACVLLACGRVDAPPDQIIIGSPIGVDSPHELLSRGGNFTSDMIDRLFISLLDEQPDFEKHPPTFAPRLASTFEFSDDHKTLTFTLRENVMWSDGVPVTAEDVRWTWQAQTSPEVGWDYAYIKEKISDVEVIDPLTVRFHFSEVYATQLLDANEGVILPKHAWGELPFSEWRKQPDWFLDRMISSGPFVLESWKPNQELILERNPMYYEPGLPRVQTVIVRIITDPASLLGQLLSGDIDMLSFVEPIEAARVQASEIVDLVIFPGRRFHFLSWNLQRPLFAETDARLALTMAIDRPIIIDTIWNGHAGLSSSPIVSSVWAYNDELVPWPHDPQRARKLLSDLGWSDEDGDGVLDRDGQRFSFELTTNPGDRTRIDALVMIQEQLRGVGVEARLRQIEFNTLNTLNLAQDYDATFTAFVMDTSLDMSYGFHSEGHFNWGGYSNAEVDRLLEEAKRQPDPAAAQSHLLGVQTILHEEQPITFLWEPMRLLGLNQRIHNAHPTSLSDFANLREWSLTP